MRTSTAGRHPGWLALPGVVFLVFFFVWPVLSMLKQSLDSPDGALGNYRRAFDSTAILHSLWVTISLSLLSTAICVALGYVYSYTVIRSRPWVASLLLGIVVIPAAINMLARIFAIQVVLQDQGIVNRLLEDIGFISQPLQLIRTRFSIVLGMVSMLLPLLVFPLYATMRRISPELVLAAQSLGAKPSVAFRRVFLPLSMPGLLAGTLLVFVSSLGYYVVPQLLGNNGSDQFLGQYVAYYVAQGNLGYGAALGIVLLVMTLATLAVASRLVRIGDVLSSSVAGRS